MNKFSTSALLFLAKLSYRLSIYLLICILYRLRDFNMLSFKNIHPLPRAQIHQFSTSALLSLADNPPCLKVAGLQEPNHLQVWQGGLHGLYQLVVVLKHHGGLQQCPKLKKYQNKNIGKKQFIHFLTHKLSTLRMSIKERCYYKFRQALIGPSFLTLH